MSCPRVSVIIPNYNHARFLHQRIESVLAQTFDDFEVLLMDDCSTDDSRSILQQYEHHPRVRLLFNESNSGNTFRQWRKGIAETRGDYVWIAESDDYAAPTFLQRMVDLLDRWPHVGLALCESNIVDDNGQLLRTSHADFAGVGDREHWQHDFIASGRSECALYLSQQNMIPNASAVVFRREIYLAAGGPDESMRLCGDWKLWIEMLLRSDLAFVAEPLNFYRFHGHSVRSRTSGWQFILETAMVMRRVHDAVEIDPARWEHMLQTLADRWVNAWLHRADSGSPANRRDALRYLQELDPKFKRRVFGRVLVRSLSLVRKGKVRQWAWHLGRRLSHP